MENKKGLEYYILDTETTGVTSTNYKHEVVEISIIRCRDRHQLTKTIRAEHPETAQAEALEITGKTYADLLKGEDRHTVVAACNAFFEQDGKTPEHRCIVAHNASFDKRFCYALWEACGEQFPAYLWMDTIKVCKLWSQKTGKVPPLKTAGGKPSFALASVLKFAGIKAMPGAHDAGSDARNTYLLWKRAMDLGLEYLDATKREPHNFVKEGVSSMSVDMSDVF